MGSNSFHLVVARVEHGEIRTLQTFREGVGLGEGLNESSRLSKAAQQRGLACLKQFGQRFKGLSRESVVVFATNALCIASNSWVFLRQAEEALGYSIQVVSGGGAVSTKFQQAFNQASNELVRVSKRYRKKVGQGAMAQCYQLL